MLTSLNLKAQPGIININLQKQQNIAGMSILQKFLESMCKCKVKDLTDFLTHARISRPV